MKSPTMQYDSTIVIMRGQEINLTTPKFEKEVYAVNVGLISKHYEFVTGLETISPDPKGNKLTYPLIRFEKP